MKINKINENQWKSMKINENQLEPMVMTNDPRGDLLFSI